MSARISLVGVRAPGGPRLMMVELAQAYQAKAPDERPLARYMQALDALTVHDAQRAGELLQVRTKVLDGQGRWEFGVYGRSSGVHHGSVRLHADGVDPESVPVRAFAQALRIALHGRSSVRPQEIDLLNELLGNPGWKCEHCDEHFVHYDDCVRHEQQAHPNAA